MSFSLFIFACDFNENAGQKETKTNVQQANYSAPDSNELSALELKARTKIEQLKVLMEKAISSDIDVQRETTLLWFSEEFLKYANWDQTNFAAVKYMFEQYSPYRQNADNLAKEIPDFQREKVIEILDAGILELQKVLAGEIQRRPVNKIDWQNVKADDNKLVSNGRPVFLYDYFSKSVGRPLTDERVYNDHLGAIFHGGENLYPVDHDRAINTFLLNEDGSFNDELMSELTGIPDTNVGFLIYWNMGVSEWIEKREPEVRKGRSLFTGYDIDNPLIQEVWGKIARHTGELTKGKKVTELGYILSNEPHWYSEEGHWSQNFGEMNEISSYTLKGFQTWLSEKYDNNINQLNKNWSAVFANFSVVNIDIPISKEKRGEPIWYDWQRYNMDRVTNWFTFLQSELLKGNPEADTHIKIMPNMYTENNRSHGIDVEALTQLTSMIGDDAKTRESRLLNYKTSEKWEEHYAYFWEEMSMSYDFMNSVSPDKIHVNSESHFLSASWWRDLDTTVEYVHSVYWLATLQGMDANFAWFWARDPDGSPEDRLEGELNFFDPALAGSFAGSVNHQPHIANAFTQVMYDLNSFSEEIIELREQKRPLRLFHSETSAINKPFHMSQQFQAYEAFFFEGFPVGFATQRIIENQDQSNWDAILVYKTEFVTQEELQSLQTYLDNGGTVILDNASSLAKNEYGDAHKQNLKESAGKLIVLSQTDMDDTLKSRALKEIESSDTGIELSEDNGTDTKGVTWRIVERENGSYLLSALNIGKHDAKVNLTHKSSAKLKVRNLMTGNMLQSDFYMSPKDVLLLEVTSVNQ